MPEEFRRMQEEAARRAREMQARARLPAVPPPGRGPEEQKQAAPTAQEVVSPKPGSVLDAVFRDPERTVILALLVLLAGEEGDPELLFALLFLLM